MKTALRNIESKNTRKGSVHDPKLDRFNGKNLFPKQFDYAQEIFSKSTFSKQVLDIINQESNK